MVEAEFGRFAKVLSDTAVVFGQSVDAVRAKAYWSVLSVLSVEDFEAAVRSHMADPKQGQFFPKPADIMRNAKPGLSSLQVANEQARQKWLAKKRLELQTGVSPFGSVEVTI